MPRFPLLVLTLLATSFTCTLPVRADDPPVADKPVQAQPGEKPGTQAEPAGRGTVIADFDNDGFLDVFVAGTLAQAGVPAQPLSEYWIGIDGTAPEDALRAQLELSAGQGLLINQVVEGGPAAKAGLKQYDVLLMCGDAPLAQISDLAKIIDERKGTTLALRLMRGGKRIIIEITPERRPASQTGVTCPTISKADDEVFARRVWLDLIGTPPTAEEIQGFIAEKRERKRDWLVNRLLRRSTVANKSCTVCHANDLDTTKLYHNLVNVHEDVVWNHNLGSTIKFDAWSGQRLLALPNTIVQLQPQVLLGDPAVQPLADDVTVSISRKGKEPVRITVRKGDRIWEFTDQDDREKIPDEARALVSPFFSSLPAAFGPYVSDYLLTRSPNVLYLNNKDGTFLDVTGRVNLNAAGAAEPVAAEPSKTPAETKPAVSEAVLERLDKQVESLNAQLGELRRAMQELRQSTRPEQGTKEK